MLRKKPIRIGALQTVHSVEYAYQLPAGLPEISTVQVLAFAHGTVTVEFEGRQYRVHMMCVDTGHERLVDGRWQDV